ncbi:MAG: hypothetical protein HC913_23920 [Microscillaceae bacterium]|nr:hypothetical protein [Microscillaceae bacterium]
MKKADATKCFATKKICDQSRIVHREKKPMHKNILHKKQFVQSKIVHREKSPCTSNLRKVPPKGRYMPHDEKETFGQQTSPLHLISREANRFNG